MIVHANEKRHRNRKRGGDHPNIIFISGLPIQMADCDLKGKLRAHETLKIFLLLKENCNSHQTNMFQGHFLRHITPRKIRKWKTTFLDCRGSLFLCTTS